MTVSGQRHLVRCRCVLSQFKGKKDAPPHHCVVFSVIGADDKAVVKHAQCNNCGLIHRVTDICTSEILAGKESMSSIVNIADVKMSLPKNLVDILDRNSAGLPEFEQAQFVLENKLWGSHVVLTQEDEAGTKHGKYVRILGESLFKVETFSREEVVVLEK